MAGKSVIYHPETDILEHEDKSPPETKRVLLYGWDADNLQKVRLGVSPTGSLAEDLEKIIIDKETTPDVIYVGYAARGTDTDDESWKVMKIDKTNLMVMTWAEGAWDNRDTSLVYT